MGKEIEIEDPDENVEEVQPRYKRIKKPKKVRIPREEYSQEPLNKPKTSRKVQNPNLLREFKSRIVSNQKESSRHLSKSKQRFLRRREFEKFTFERMEKAKRTMGLNSLSDALVGIPIPQNEKPKKQISDSSHKEKTIQEETERMKAVLASQIFQKDPLNTLKTHLRNSLKRNN